MREKLAVRNSLMSMLSIFISIVIGLVVPRVILSRYGSEVNGMISSINQFLNYITILESGVGAVVVATSYKPFAMQDYGLISRIISASKKFFRKLTLVFLVYVAVLAAVYPAIGRSSMADGYVRMLVAVSGISLFVQYCYTIQYSLLLQAAQRYYIASMTSMVLQLVNAVVMIAMINSGADILPVKLVSSLVFVLNPIVLSRYVRKHYPQVDMNADDGYVIPQKRDTLIHNLSYVIHNNTAIVFITLFLSVRDVSVYHVYNMVVSSIRRLLEGLSNGVQAALGDMLAKDETDTLRRTFYMFEQGAILVAGVIFTMTTAMIMPFVSLYTADVTDVQYIRPLFAYLLVLSEAVYIFRLPYHTMVKASACFRETKKGVICEVIINLAVSAALIPCMGLAGVAVGALVSVAYRLVYYLLFFQKHILCLRAGRSLLKVSVNMAAGAAVVATSGVCMPAAVFSSVTAWVAGSAVLVAAAGALFWLVNSLLFPEDMRMVSGWVLKRKR